MKHISFILMFFVFVLSANSQSEKYIEVINSSFYIFNTNVPTSNTVNSLETTINGSVLDNQQKDSIALRNSDYQPKASLVIDFKNVSQKKIKSISYLFEYTDGKKIFYKNKYTTKINLNSNENKKIRHGSHVISSYLANSKGFKKITITKIVFDDKSSIKF